MILSTIIVRSVINLLSLFTLILTFNVIFLTCRIENMFQYFTTTITFLVKFEIMRFIIINFIVGGSKSLNSVYHEKFVKIIR